MVDKLENIKYIKDDFGLLCSLEKVLINENRIIKKTKDFVKIEIVFKNNNIEIMQETIGLWTRLAWNYYNKIKE